MLRPDVVKEVQDLRYLKWTRARESSGTAGSYLKSFEIRDGKKIYYKLSAYDSIRGITGHESVNELIADRLLTCLGIEHVSYQLIHATVLVEGQEVTTWVCASENFRLPGENKMALDTFYDLHHQKGEKPLDFCVRYGWDKYLYEMLVVDFLILNRDRHGANMEVLLDVKNNQFRLAPLFDHGLSLVYSCKDEETLAKFDVMADLPVQCYVGSRSATENLKLVPGEQFRALRPLEERDGSLIFKDLEECLPAAYAEKIRNMIWKRWQYCENLFHS